MGETDAERWARMSEELAALVPAAPTDRPVSEWTAAELLADTARLGLLRVREIVSAPVDMSDPRIARIVGDMGMAVAKLYATVQIAGLQSRQDRGEEALRRAIAEFRAASGRGESSA